MRRYCCDRPVYDKKLWDVLGVSAFYVGEYEVGRDAARRALAVEPRNARMRKNLAFYTRKLAEAAGKQGKKEQTKVERSERGKHG